MAEKDLFSILHEDKTIEKGFFFLFFSFLEKNCKKSQKTKFKTRDTLILPRFFSIVGQVLKNSLHFLLQSKNSDLSQKSIDPINDVIIYEFEKCLYYIPELEILKVFLLSLI
jgi:hypothetical protein